MKILGKDDIEVRVQGEHVSLYRNGEWIGTARLCLAHVITSDDSLPNELYLLEKDGAS